MISALFLALLLALQMYAPPAAAQPSMDAQCEAWLCLPGAFEPAECSPAKAAVDWRLSRVPPLDPLPPWSSCATHYSAVQANLHFDNNYRSPRCGRSTGHGTVWVRVDGQRVGAQYEYTRQEPVRPCPPPPPPVLDPDPTDTTTEIPETDPCVTDPASCEEPETDPCVIDPASCEEPETDPCVIDPASCEEPETDPCVIDPASCHREPTCEERGDCPTDPDPDPPPFTPPVGPPVPPPPAAPGGAPGLN